MIHKNTNRVTPAQRQCHRRRLPSAVAVRIEPRQERPVRTVEIITQPAASKVAWSLARKGHHITSVPAETPVILVPHPRRQRKIPARRPETEPASHRILNQRLHSVPNQNRIRPVSMIRRRNVRASILVEIPDLRRNRIASQLIGRRRIETPVAPAPHHDQPAVAVVGDRQIDDRVTVQITCLQMVVPGKPGRYRRRRSKCPITIASQKTHRRCTQVRRRRIQPPVPVKVPQHHRIWIARRMTRKHRLRRKPSRPVASQHTDRVTAVIRHNQIQSPVTIDIAACYPDRRSTHRHRRLRRKRPVSIAR